MLIIYMFSSKVMKEPIRKSQTGKPAFMHFLVLVEYDGTSTTFAKLFLFNHRRDYTNF